MQDETTNFLKTLFAPYPSAGRETIELRCLNAAGGQGNGPRRWFPLTAGGLRAAAWLGQAWSDRWNVYFGVLPRCGERAGGTDAVTMAAWLWCDIDNAPTWEAAAILLCKAELPAPHLVVGSGNGCHVYWQLADVEPLPDAESKAQFRSLLRRLCAAVSGEPDGPHGDVASTDVARILRLPGTCNWKNPAAPKPVSVLLRCDVAPRLTTDDWRDLLPAEPQRGGREQGTGNRGQRIQSGTRYVTQHQLLREVSPVGSRHRNCVRLLTALRNRNANAAEQEAAGRDFCALNAFPLDEMEAILRWTIGR